MPSIPTDTENKVLPHKIPDKCEKCLALTYSQLITTFSFVQTSCHHAISMTSSGLMENVILTKLYILQMTLFFCDVWQMECHADNMANGKAM